jgi:ankyrin repeat protein
MNFKWMMKLAVFGIVLIGYSSAKAGIYEDFFTAVRQDANATVVQILFRGFDPNTIDPKGRSPLMAAIQEGSSKVANLLVSLEQVDVNALNPTDESALMLASLKGQEDMVRKLIARGADINKTGWTPLHYAASGGHVGVMRLLFEHHAYVDPESPNGTTPLMMAAQYGNGAAVKLLLDEGAVPTARNRLGLSALDFARLGKRPDAQRLLAPLLATPAANSTAPVGSSASVIVGSPIIRSESAGGAQPAAVAPLAVPAAPAAPAASSGRW